MDEHDAERTAERQPFSSGRAQALNSRRERLIVSVHPGSLPKVLILD